MFKRPELTPIEKARQKWKRELMKKATEKFDRDNPKEEKPKSNTGWVL
jgi:hypothetical protein